MNPNLVTAVRKRRGLDHQGLPLESTSPYGGLSEADLNATGPLEGPEQPPPELPTPAPHEVAAAQQALDETEAVQPRPGSVPAQVGQAVMAAAPVDNDAEEMAAAQEADRNARNNGRIELAAKQFVSGVTQTPQAGVSQAGPAQVPQAQARAKSRREQVADELMRRRQGVMDASALDLQKSQTEKNRRDPGPKGGVDYTASRDAKLALDRERFDEQKRAALVREELARQKAARSGKPKPLEDVPPGFEVSAGSYPSKEARKKFTGLVSSAEKMKGLTRQMRTALQGTSGLSRTLDPKTVTTLKQLGTMIAIEGKNIAGLGALSGPDMGLMNAIAADPTSVKTNLTVDLPKMLDQLDSWGDASIDGDSKATGIVRSAAKGGKVKVSNGKETYEIDAADLKDAEADGYKAVR